MFPISCCLCHVFYFDFSIFRVLFDRMRCVLTRDFVNFMLSIFRDFVFYDFKFRDL